jgi:hypothetical protein
LKLNKAFYECSKFQVGATGKEEDEEEEEEEEDEEEEGCLAIFLLISSLSTRTTCPDYLILLTLITIFSEECIL